MKRILFFTACFFVLYSAKSQSLSMGSCATLLVRAGAHYVAVVEHDVVCRRA